MDEKTLFDLLSGVAEIMRGKNSQEKQIRIEALKRFFKGRGILFSHNLWEHIYNITRV